MQECIEFASYLSGLDQFTVLCSGCSISLRPPIFPLDLTLFCANAGEFGGLAQNDGG